MSATFPISEKNGTVSNLEKDTNSIEQLFAVYFSAATVSTAVRWMGHWFSNADWRPLLVDGILLVGLFLFWMATKRRQPIPRLVEIFLLSMQLGIAALWLFFLPVYALLPPIILFLIFLYLLYINQGDYLLWTVGGSFVIVVIALALQWLNRSQVMGLTSSAGQWQFYTQLTLYISTGAVVSLTYVYHRVNKEREQQLAQTQSLERARYEAEQKRDLMAQLRALQSDFFLEEDLQPQFDLLLQQLLEFTKSKFGFLAEVVVDDEHQLLDSKLHASVYNEQFERLSAVDQDRHLRQAFERMVAERKPVIDNGANQRHGEAFLFNIQSYLSLPVMYDYKVVGHVLLTNRLEGYQSEQVEELDPFLSTYGSVLQNIRLKRAQRDYENRLRKAKEEAEANDRRKSQFLTNISHELRTPLSLIMGPLNLLQQIPLEQLKAEEWQQHLQTMDRNSKRMREYLEDILDLARLDVQELSINHQPTALHALLQTCYQAYQIEAQERSFTYQLDYELEPQLHLSTDADKLQKILDGLLSNAFRYSRNGGTVTIKAHQKADWLCLSIIDQGRGIPLEQQGHIFERFYQIEVPDETIFAGTGLGLALCKELAEALHYQIEVESVVGEGSRFTVKVPIQYVVAAPAPAQPAPVSVANGTATDPMRPCLLVAEDHRDMRLFLEQVLKADYEVVVVEDGQRAWERLSQQPEQFDLLITDLMMPHLDGYALLELVHAQPWAARLPIVVLTAKTQFDDRLGNLRIGMDDYLTKPFEVGELLATVRYLLSNRLFK